MIGNSKRDILSEDGDAVVEATVLFPIMTMIFAALVLISIYLPSQAMLQRATQYAATAVATEISDTWLFYDESDMAYYRETDINRLSNVFEKLLSTDHSTTNAKGEIIAEKVESGSISSKEGKLTVECYTDDKLIYREIIVEAAREYPMPVDLSFIGFPKTITVSVSSTAVVQNGDEFIRSIDLATDFVEFIIDKYDLHDVGNAISSFGSEVRSKLNW